MRSLCTMNSVLSGPTMIFKVVRKAEFELKISISLKSDLTGWESHIDIFNFLTGGWDEDELEDEWCKEDRVEEDESKDELLLAGQPWLDTL